MSSNASNFWNRETSQPRNYNANAPVVKQAKIIALSDPKDPSNAELYKGQLPEGAELLAVGSCMDDFDMGMLQVKGANVVFVSHSDSREPLADLLKSIPTIEWVHTRSAGIDFVTSPTLSQWAGTVTNAKGHFSSTLAEYAMLACSYL